MKFKFNKVFVLLAFFVMTLGIAGVYGNWYYLTAGIDGDSSRFDVDINEFEYPEWTVNFYTTGPNSTYTRDKKLLASHTFKSINETWTFPTNAGTSYPEQTFKLWSSSLFYYGGNEKVYELQDFTRADSSKLTGQTYQAGVTYKCSDIAWNDDGTLDLFEITEESNFSVASDPELTVHVTCDSPSFGTQHPKSSFPMAVPSYLPYLNLYASTADVYYNNTVSECFNFFIQFLDDGFETKASPDINEKTISWTPYSYSSNKKSYRIIKEKPPLTGQRVTTDTDRDTDFKTIDNVEMVDYYLMEDPIVVYLTPGASLGITSGPKIKNTKTYAEYNGGSSKHKDDTFGHTLSPQLNICDTYNGSISLRFDSLDAANYLLKTTVVNPETSENEIIYVPKYLSITVRWDNHYDYVVTECNNSDHCLIKGSPILMADGSYVPVEDIKAGDMLVVFNHETGTLDYSPVIFNDSEEIKDIEVVELNFSNGKQIGVVSEHGFFDLTIGKYVYITADNVNNYVGHYFYGLEGEKVKLDYFNIKHEYTTCYSPVTAFHLNYFVDGLLSMPGGIPGLFNIFDYGQDLKYIEKNKIDDIQKYGLFTYDDFKEYLPYEAYCCFPGPYLKVSICKGLTTFDDILSLIDRYEKFW